VARTREDSEDAFISKLPFYNTKPSQDFPGWLIVKCEREGCKGTFIVLGRLWKKRPFIGRSCPYCFRVSRIPNKRTPSKRAKLLSP
jgi:hypothetical protein